MSVVGDEEAKKIANMVATKPCFDDFPRMKELIEVSIPALLADRKRRIEREKAVIAYIENHRDNESCGSEVVILCCNNILAFIRNPKGAE